jgi:hypothetical protein
MYQHEVCLVNFGWMHFSKVVAVSWKLQGSIYPKDVILCFFTKSYFFTKQFFLYKTQPKATVATAAADTMTMKERDGDAYAWPLTTTAVISWIGSGF